MNLLELQSDPAAFRNALLIDTDAGPRPLGECMDPWQAADFHALDSGWQRAVVGSTATAKYSRGWLERGRGASKTSDLAVMASWALFASRRRLSGIGAAGDQDQARLLRDAIGRLLYVNPWLASILEIQAYRVLNLRTESTLEIITSDAKTSYGLTPDFIVCDEIVHWKNRDLWDSLLSSAAKRSTSMLVIITNAGLRDDWTWQTREAVRNDPTWYFSRLDGPIASWITPEALAEQERLLPSIAFRRLWLNEWTTGGGDALSAEAIAAAFHADLRPQTEAAAGFEYTAGLDLGVSRDASAVVVLGVHRGSIDHGRIRLAFTRIWRPCKGSKVDLQAVEDCLIDLNERFKLKAINYDPWEARHMAQRLSAVGLGVAENQLRRFNRQPVPTSRVPMVEISQTGANLQKIATVLIEAFNDHRLELFDDPDLRRDITRLRVEERQYGFRLTSPRDELGHGDMASAFSLAMLAASELAGKRQPFVVRSATEATIFDTMMPIESTPLQRAQHRYDAEAAAYVQEMEMLHKGGSDHNGVETFRNTMQRLFGPGGRW